MGRRIPKTVIFRGFTGIFTALMVLTGSIRSVALDWEDKVNELLGLPVQMLSAARTLRIICIHPILGR